MCTENDDKDAKVKYEPFFNIERDRPLVVRFRIQEVDHKKSTDEKVVFRSGIYVISDLDMFMSDGGYFLDFYLKKSASIGQVWEAC